MDFYKFDENKKAILEALLKNASHITKACAAVNISRQTFYNYIRDDEAFKQAVIDLEELLLDDAESYLRKQMTGYRTPDGKEVTPDTTAIIFFLKTKGKKRGYIERHEWTGADGAPLEMKVIVSKPEEASAISDV